MLLLVMRAMLLHVMFAMLLHNLPRNLLRNLPPAQKNHLAGLQRQLLRLSFFNVQQLMEVRREVQPCINKNKARAKTTQAYQDMAALQAGGAQGAGPAKVRASGSNLGKRTGLLYPPILFTPSTSTSTIHNIPPSHT